jgi:DNA-binding NarL/FixJ family response regulator
MIRLLVVERVRLVGDLIGNALEGEPDIHIVATATDEADALEMLQAAACDIALVSTSLPDNGAMSLLKAVRDQELDAKMLVMGVEDTHTVIMAYINAGAFGYVTNEAPPQELVANIRAAYEDKALISPAMAGRLIERIATLTDQLVDLGIDSSDYEELTPREQEVLEMISQGLTNQEIAEALVIELGTVKNHVHNILSKLHVNSRKDAALYLTLWQDEGQDLPLDQEPSD